MLQLLYSSGRLGKVLDAVHVNLHEADAISTCVRDSLYTEISRFVTEECGLGLRKSSYVVQALHDSSIAELSFKDGFNVNVNAGAGGVHKNKKVSAKDYYFLLWSDPYVICAIQGAGKNAVNGLVSVDSLLQAFSAGILMPALTAIPALNQDDLELLSICLQSELYNREL